MRRTNIFIIAVLLLLLLSGCNSDSASSEAVASVNNQIITQDEFDYFKSKNRASVISDYLNDYSIEYSENFWETEFDGKTPQQELNEITIKECALAKIQLVLMEENGIYTDITYQGLYEKAIAYNNENSGKQSVVGVKSINMDSFYEYYIDNGVMELKNILAESVLKPTQDELAQKTEELQGILTDADENEISNSAISAVVDEKYDKYISDIYENADIKWVSDEITEN